MSRWQPNALQRLQQAAMELFLEKGYERTTVEEIAQRAQLTQRTFFRYFADKREVLFSDNGAFELAVINNLRKESSPDPLNRLIKTFESLAAEYFDASAERVKLRRRIIQSSPELQEREGQKMARIGEQATAILLADSVDAKAARFAVDLGILVFRRAFEEWAENEDSNLAIVIVDNLAYLRTMTQNPQK